MFDKHFSSTGQMGNISTPQFSQVPKKNPCYATLNTHHGDRPLTPKEMLELGMWSRHLHI